MLDLQIAVWQARRVRPEGLPLWVSLGGMSGDVVKQCELQAAPPLRIHQALIFKNLYYRHPAHPVSCAQ